MTKSYPWAPFPIKSLAGWRADKSTSGAMQPSESDWFISWWNLASQRPKTARGSNKIGSTGMTQHEIDEGFKKLFLPLIALFVVNINWGGKIPTHLKTRRSQIQDAKAKDVAIEDSDEIVGMTNAEENADRNAYEPAEKNADEDSLSEISGIEMDSD
jgi:hypothetical protein